VLSINERVCELLMRVKRRLTYCGAIPIPIQFRPLIRGITTLVTLCERRRGGTTLALIERCLGTRGGAGAYSTPSRAAFHRGLGPRVLGWWPLFFSPNPPLPSVPNRSACKISLNPRQPHFLLQYLSATSQRSVAWYGQDHRSLAPIRPAALLTSSPAGASFFAALFNTARRYYYLQPAVRHPPLLQAPFKHQPKPHDRTPSTLRLFTWAVGKAGQHFLFPVSNTLFPHLRRKKAERARVPTLKQLKQLKHALASDPSGAKRPITMVPWTLPL
jgi:hypothetical protein